jgi:hypothetical protein
MAQKITNAQAEEIERLTNASIHELVFFNHHVGEDDHSSAQETLTQLNLNVERIGEILASKEGK